MGEFIRIVLQFLAAAALAFAFVAIVLPYERGEQAQGEATQEERSSTATLPLAKAHRPRSTHKETSP